MPKSRSGRRPLPALAGSSKFARYRDNKRKQGMRLLRIWVPDVTAPGFQEELERQARLVSAASDNAAVLDMIEDSLAEVTSWKGP